MISNKSILIIDDNRITRLLLVKIFKKDYEVLEADDGKIGFDLLLQDPSRICAILLNLNMPVMDGWQFIDKMKELNLLRLIPIIIVTAETIEEVETRALENGVSDIINTPIVPKTVYCRVKNVISANHHKRNLEAAAKDLSYRLHKSNETMIDTLSSIIEHRSLESGQHIKRIRSFTEILLREIKKNYPEYGLNDKIIYCIASASTLHDIGKIIIPDSILNKPGRLTTEEFETMKSHTVHGGDIIRKLDFVEKKDYLEYAWQIAMYHHERYDGKGYPSGLIGDDIPLCAQVAAIADVYDALTTPRVYKPAFSHEKTVRMIVSGECGAFSEKIKHCFRLVSDQFEEKARQYRDGEINLEEFGFTPELEEDNDLPDYLDNYRYDSLVKESGDIILEIDYASKKHGIIYSKNIDFSSVQLYGDISQDISIFVDKFVHPEDCINVLQKANLAMQEMEKQNFVSDKIFARLQFDNEDKYQWYEIKQFRYNTPETTSCRTIVIFTNVEKYINQDFANYESKTILKSDSFTKKIENTPETNDTQIQDIGLTTEMIYDMFRSTCDILYILNLDSGKTIVNYNDENDFTNKVPETINDFVSNKCVTIHEDDLEHVLENASKAVKSVEEVDTEFRMLSKQGEFKKYNHRIVPIKGTAGNVSHLVGFINHKHA